ncbi:unnamed protein product [Leptidea sinapis]|uniref:Fatty acyl-CoA reductase C-terminal domain-containing protein n=1 Tax=Leptidea sinapis TaxID=189913 RepID=A0A5E4PS16_9NEOP|nr:unnamed protein product [Leptidea sinapis]
MNSLVNVQKRVTSGLGVIQYYAIRPWKFSNQRYLALRSQISEDEDRLFYTDIKSMDWQSYMKEYVRGSRDSHCGHGVCTFYI